MKLYFLISCFGWIAACSLFADETNPQQLVLTVDAIAEDGTVTVGVHNKTSKDLGIWVSDFSWAWDNWRVFVLRNGDIRLYCGYPNEAFTMNIPANVAIKPGSTWSEILHLGTEEWKGKDDLIKSENRPLMLWEGPKDTKPILQKGDKIIVIYDARWSMESNKYNVWTGIASVTKDYLPK